MLIEELFKNYHQNILIIETGAADSNLVKQMEFLNKSMELLSNFDNAAVKLVFIERQSKKDAARYLHVTRMTLDRRLKKVIIQISEVYERVINKCNKSVSKEDTK